MRAVIAGSKPIPFGGAQPSQVLNPTVLGQAKVLRRKGPSCPSGPWVINPTRPGLKPILKWVVKKRVGSFSDLDKISSAGLVSMGAGVSSGKLSGPPLALPRRY
jgi:hypothetical protein